MAPPKPSPRYVNGGGGLLAIDVIDGDVSFPLFNPHGDVWGWTDHQGDITATSSFDEYGVPQQATSGDPEVDRYGWLGRQQREWDPQVGLTLMGVRGYDPALGRFLSVDPIRGGSANDYDYVAGDPINSYDLDGKARWQLWLLKCRQTTREWLWTRSWGTVAAGAINLGWGYWKIRRGMTQVVMAAPLMFSTYAGWGPAMGMFVYGGYNLTTGTYRLSHGMVQVGEGLARPCRGCGLGHHLRQFVSDMVPRKLLDWLSLGF